jgi:hypothetical protein
MSQQCDVTMTADDLRGDIPPSLARPAQKPADKTSRWPWIALFLLIVGVATTAGGIWLVHSHADSSLAPAAFVAGPFFLIAGAAAQLGITRQRRLEEVEDESCVNDCRDLYWALDKIDDRTLQGLAWVNYKQLRTFIKIAQRQALVSFYASLVAAAAGLLVLTSITAVAIGLPTTSGKVIAGLLAAAGSALSGYLTSTFLTSYQMASQQMSYYYGQPLVHCYLLLADWLAAKGREEFGTAEGRLLLRKVIDASVTAAADAQHHLLSMQVHGQGGKTAGILHRRGAPSRGQAPVVPRSFGPLPGAN